MDVTTFTDKYLATSRNNDAAWVDARYNALCQEAKGETDPQRRLDLLAEAEAILVDEVPILPLYHYVNTYILADAVTGLPENPRMMIQLKRVATHPAAPAPASGRSTSCRPAPRPSRTTTTATGVPDHGDHAH